MIKVPDEAKENTYKFLNKIAIDYHTRLFPLNLDNISRIKYETEMCNKIKQDPMQLVITNINRHTNKTRDFVSVRRMRIGDEIFFNDIDVGEL